MNRLLFSIFAAAFFFSSVSAEEKKKIEPVCAQAAVLRTVIVSGDSTRAVSADFNAMIQKNLQSQKIIMADLAVIEEMLKKHPYEVLSAGKDIYSKLGKVLHAEYLLVPRINKFDVSSAVVLIEPGNKPELRKTGIFEGVLTVYDGKNGQIAVVIPFSEKIDFSAVQEKNDDWNILKYYEYMMKKAADKLSVSAGEWLKDHIKK